MYAEDILHFSDHISRVFPSNLMFVPCSWYSLSVTNTWHASFSEHWCYKPVSQTQLWVQSTTTDYIRAENKLQSILKLFLPQVIIPQVSFSQTTSQILSTISECKPRKTLTHVSEPIYIPWALNTEICIQQGDLLYSAGLHRNQC